jgi:hypothetical protein
MMVKLVEEFESFVEFLTKNEVNGNELNRFDSPGLTA